MTLKLQRWLTFLLVFVALIYAVIDSSYTWRGDFGIQTFGICFFGVCALVLFIWRVFFHRAKMPRSELGWVFALGCVVVLLSLAFSADPRQSLWRVGWLAGYVVLFYLFLDGFDSGWLERRAALNALLIVSGGVMALALLETYAWYQNWFTSIGKFGLPPYQYRFGGVFGYSNVLMSLANLAAPLALLSFLRGANRGERVGGALWMVLYVLAIPFSSSRGGWIGMGGWIAALVALWIIDRKPWRVLRAWPKRRLWLMGGGALLALVGGAFLALRFWLTFAAHPSHGSDPFGGRGYLWAGALRLWEMSPWVGIGPGRYVLEIPKVMNSTPPGFWPYNAHGMYVQILAEFGLLGALTAIIGLVAVVFWLWRKYRQVASARLWAARGLLAGVVGWLAQMVVDDFSGWISVMIPLIMAAAWIGTSGEPSQMIRRKKLSFGWIGVALLGLLAFSAYDLWTFHPMSKALDAAEQADWKTAAELSSRAAERDPRLTLYATEAGLAWAQAWGESGDPQALEQARGWLQTSLDREPQFSVLWADFAVLEWQAGQQASAIEKMAHAAEMSPNEPSYALNLGWMLEESGQTASAQQWYIQALNLAPRLAGHPFWAQTATRQQAEAAREPVADAKAPVYIPQIDDAISAGDWDQAQRLLALAVATNENGALVNYWRGRLGESQGDQNATEQAYLRVRESLDLPILWTTSNFSFGYTRWGYNRPGLLVDLVPGYGQLVGSADLWDGMERLHTLQVQQGDCAEAARTWDVWHESMSGGIPAELPPAPACP